MSSGRSQEAALVAGCGLFLSCAFVAGALSCATTPAVGEEPLPRVDVDPALGADAVNLTAELIRSRPENPPGNERRAVDVIAARLQEAGVEVTVAPFAGDPRRANLKAVVRAGKRPSSAAASAKGRGGVAAAGERPGPILLLGHSDVVPADPAEWSVNPFEGVLQNGRVVGRGAYDMLSMDALEILTMIALQTEGRDKLTRDVILVIEGDEEADGKGMQQALFDWPELKDAAWALTEGGAFLEGYLRPGEDLAAVAVAEKGIFQLKLTTRGPSGHGSTPVAGAAPDRLVRAVERVLRRPVPFEINDVTARQLRDIGAAHGGLEGLVLSSPPLAAALAKPLLDASPSSAALFRNTCSLTMLDAGLKRNVIPGTASATFDCRLLPGVDPHAFRDALLAQIDDPRVELTVLEANAASGSDPDAPVVDAIRRRIKAEVPTAAVVATLSKGATDCRFLRKAGVPCYGFIPIRITREELDAMHGKDEGVRTEELEKALPRLIDIVTFLASSPGGPP